MDFPDYREHCASCGYPAGGHPHTGIDCKKFVSNPEEHAKYQRIQFYEGKLRELTGFVGTGGTW